MATRKTNKGNKASNKNTNKGNKAVEMKAISKTSALGKMIIAHWELKQAITKRDALEKDSKAWIAAKAECKRLEKLRNSLSDYEVNAGGVKFNIKSSWFAGVHTCKSSDEALKKVKTLMLSASIR